MREPTAKSAQHIARLTPLGEVEHALDRRAGPTAARALELDLAVGRVLALDLSPAGASATTPVAARDGFAVRADLVADAGAYAPVPITAAWIEAGQPLPDDSDAVLPPDALIATHGGDEAIAPVSPGEGVLTMLAGGKQEPLRQAGEALRATDIAALRALGVDRVEVREPLVYVVSTNREVAAAADTVAPLIAAAVEAAGGRAHIMRAVSGPHALESALHDGAADAVITIGGTGEGRGDRTVAIVAAHGELLLHGFGLKPGETAALGAVGARPVLMLPGRLDAALAAWLVVGRRLLARLTGEFSADDAAAAPSRAGGNPATSRSEVPAFAGPSGRAPLTRKIASTVGLAEVVFVRRRGKRVEPLASGLPPHAVARADGWVLVPAGSEGYPARTMVDVRPLP
jgi:molybdopterin biosynthesis enzyme